MFGVDPRPISGTGLEPITQDTYNYVLEWMEDRQQMEALINGQVNDNLAQAMTRMKTYTALPKVALLTLVEIFIILGFHEVLIY